MSHRTAHTVAHDSEFGYVEAYALPLVVVEAVEVVDGPLHVAVVVLVEHFNFLLVHKLVNVLLLAVVQRAVGNIYKVWITLFESFVNLMVFLVIHGSEVFVSYFDIFQRERFWMPVFGTHGSVLAACGTNGILDCVQGILNVVIHIGGFVHEVAILVALHPFRADHAHGYNIHSIAS